MAQTFTVAVEGLPGLKDRLRQINPERNRRITRPALLEMMQFTLRTSAREHIYPGGRKGAPARTGILTSRSGDLRRSLGFKSNINTVGLRNPGTPFIEGGTHLIYGAVHELGRYRGRNMPKRPFLAPGLKQSAPKFDAIYLKHWKREAEL